MCESVWCKWFEKDQVKDKADIELAKGDREKPFSWVIALVYSWLNWSNH